MLRSGKERRWDKRDYMVDGIVIDSDPVVTAGNVELWDFEYAEKIVMGKFWM